MSKDDNRTYLGLTDTGVALHLGRPSHTKSLKVTLKERGKTTKLKILVTIGGVIKENESYVFEKHKRMVKVVTDNDLSDFPPTILGLCSI